MSAPAMPLAPQFDSPAQQGEAAHTGMWVFLASETLFFGVLFFGYAVTRLHFSHAFAAASKHTDVVLGTLNTVVLLTSSYFVALAVQAAEDGQRARARRLLWATLALGATFLVIKGTEYHADFAHQLVPGHAFVFEHALRRGAELFFYLYFVMTGIHAVHLLIGMGLVGTIAWRMRREPEQAATPLALGALYWHLVDMVWIFLYPLFYLVLRT
jgi:cytochrome c oxidase subunit 3